MNRRGRPSHYHRDGTPFTHEIDGLDNDAAEGFVKEFADEFRRDRSVGDDLVESFGQDARVSTVFLVLDHAWQGRPLLFETMVFGGLDDGLCVRYSTEEEALAGHDEIVGRLRSYGTTEPIADVERRVDDESPS